jgi:hypothetical protein
MNAYSSLFFMLYIVHILESISVVTPVFKTPGYPKICRITENHLHITYVGTPFI